MNPRVKAVRANDDFTLAIRFENSETRVFDMKPYLEHGVFSELKDLPYFKAVRVTMGTVEWPHGQDICPDTLYEGGIPTDPSNPDGLPHPSSASSSR
jgi:hypothetical protein